MLLAMHPLVLLAIGAGFGAFALGGWYFSPRQRALRAIRSVPRVLVSEAVDGSIVRIVGQLRAHAPLLAAPLSGRACASYDVVVEERVKSGKSSHWRGLVHESESRDFVVEDSSGRALVEASQLEPTIVLDHHQSSGFLSDAAPALEAFLARYGHEVVGFLGMNKTLRYREGVLEPGETVAVIGRVRWEDDPEPGAISTQHGGYRDTARRRRLVIEPSELGPVRASDEPSALD